MKNIYRLMMALVAAFVMTSCLDEDTSTVVSPKNFYKDASQIRTGLNSAYYPMTFIYRFEFMIAIEGSTDLASTDGSKQKDATLEINPADPACGDRVWQYAYVGVRNVTAAIAGIERSPLAYKDKIDYLGEGKILRAFYYYILTSFFGDVPFYLDYIETVEDQTRIGKLPRMSAFETRKALIEDLMEIVPHMTQIRTCDIPKTDAYPGRVTASMGWMLIAKLAMWNKDWDTALDAISRLENLYGDLSQYKLDDIQFSRKLTPESIFEVQHAYQKGGISMSSNVATVCLPQRNGGEKDVFDGVKIDTLGTEATAYTPLRPTAYMRETIMPSDVEDKRRELNMVSSWGMDENGNPIKFTSGKTWMGPKFWCYNMYSTNDSNNHPVFRYADALLMAAECHCEKKNLKTAIEYYNKVRSRAEAAPYSLAESYITLQDEIRKERARELFGEFHRKFDLVRWGIWYTNTKAYNNYSTLQNAIKPCHEYYPIPDAQVLATGGALDNNEYKKYGL